MGLDWDGGVCDDAGPTGPLPSGPGRSGPSETPGAVDVKILDLSSTETERFVEYFVCRTKSRKKKLRLKQQTHPSTHISIRRVSLL